MPQELRDYQVEAIDELRGTFKSGFRSAVLVAPTGAGKTTIAAHIIEGALRNGRKVVFLAHRKELIDQCSKRLDDQDIDHGIIKAGNKRRNGCDVQVASLMSLIHRVKPGDDELELGPRYPADLFIIDECHRATAHSYLEILKCYPRAVLLGLTATPIRTDGRGLGQLFQTLVQASTPAELTERGYLVPARVFTTPMTPDFSKVKQKKGDFDQGEVERLVDKPKLIGDIYGHWKKLAGDRQTVIFAASCRHALHIKDDFLAKGARIEYLDGDTPERDRDAVLARLQRRDTQIVVNVGILTEGWDNPAISCVILARPTKSLTLYLQMAGRALRTDDGKVDCIILDHGGNTARHGFVTDEREWDLNGKKPPKVQIDSLTTCKTCFAVFAGKAACPECGAAARPAAVGSDGAIPKQEEGTLQEVDPRKQTQEEVLYFQEQLRLQEEKGYKENYARARFFEKYGRWPGRKHGLKKEWERTQDEHGTTKWKLKSWEFRPPGQKLVPGAGAGLRTGT